MPPGKDQTKAIKALDSIVTGNNSMLVNLAKQNSLLSEQHADLSQQHLAMNDLNVLIAERLDFLLNREYLSEFVETKVTTKDGVISSRHHRRELTFEQWKEGHCVR